MWDSMLLFIRLPECMCPVCRLCLVSCNLFFLNGRMWAHHGRHLDSNPDPNPPPPNYLGP